MTSQFVDVTEIAGQRISAEQLYRTCHRYHWAANLGAGKDVLEVACGSGPGLGLLRKHARSLAAGDFSPEVLAAAQNTYGDAIPLSVFGAEDLPFADASFDVILMFEALYYIPDVNRFFAEAWRVLRPGGQLLLVTANKDLFDFTPSPYSRRYLGAAELGSELNSAGFGVVLGGLMDINKVGPRQKLLRPLKKIASDLNLIPKSMHGKEWLKKLFFGSMTMMPPDIASTPFKDEELTPIPGDAPDKRHKVIYCQATRPN